VCISVGGEAQLNAWFFVHICFGNISIMLPAVTTLVCNHAGDVAKAVSKKITIRNTDAKPVRFAIAHVATLAQDYEIQVPVHFSACYKCLVAAVVWWLELLCIAFAKVLRQQKPLVRTHCRLCKLRLLP
jgi:hypothetical protein